MRLIDADKLLEETRRDRDYARKNGFLDMYYERQVLIDRIKAQPTAYDPEKVVEQLEELKAIKSDGFTDDLLNMGFTKGYNKAIDDFVKFANTMPTVEEEDGTIRPMWLEEMAEQIKRKIQ